MQNAEMRVLATALCRIFTQDGYKTAPFKSQNMTAVCHELADGRKMARSQAISAYACNMEPEPDMNPVLLVLGNGGVEVRISGNSIGIMSSEGFKAYKKQAFEQALNAFARLSESNDIVVVEGAGSPVELNLNSDDIVNMGLAKAIGAPVLLVSDIQRGGVFASLYGTMALLSEDEKKLVKGLVVNKFIGSIEHFGDGAGILKQLCGVPVLGVIPFMDVRLEDEDSLSDGELKTRESLYSGAGGLDYYTYMQGEFDRIAAHVRGCLDMAKVYGIVECRV
jgi:adenosylcobyric acid synthase